MTLICPHRRSSSHSLAMQLTASNGISVIQQTCFIKSAMFWGSQQSQRAWGINSRCIRQSAKLTGAKKEKTAVTPQSLIPLWIMGMTVWPGMLSDTLFTQLNKHLSLQLDCTLLWSHSSTADCHAAAEPILHCDIMSKQQLKPYMASWLHCQRTMLLTLVWDNDSAAVPPFLHKADEKNPWWTFQQYNNIIFSNTKKKSQPHGTQQGFAQNVES